MWKFYTKVDRLGLECVVGAVGVDDGDIYSRVDSERHSAGQSVEFEVDEAGRARGRLRVVGERLFPVPGLAA